MGSASIDYMIILITKGAAHNSSKNYMHYKSIEADPIDSEE
jgi:hypothetical protein